MTDIIGPAQYGYVPGRGIRDIVLEAVIVGQVAVRDASVRGGVDLLDFKKAYDRLNRKFLFHTVGAIGPGNRNAIAFPFAHSWSFRTEMQSASGSSGRRTLRAGAGSWSEPLCRRD
jgi:hypothetical protein